MSATLEQVQALGFATVEESEAHDLWLWQTAGERHQAWVRSINPDRANELENLSKQ